MTSLSGCVLPVGPRFEDPPTTENTPPFINSVDPPLGIVPAATNKVGTFRVTYSDLNTGDALIARWLAEYPPFTMASHLLGDVPAPIPAQLEMPSVQSVSCQQNALALNTTFHNITVLISDQPFWDLADKDAPTDPVKLLTQNKANSVMAQATWVLNVQCP